MLIKSEWTNSDKAGSCVFTLTGFGAHLPTCRGAILSATTCQVRADEQGQIVQDLLGNDLIEPQGTQYQISVYDKHQVLLHESMHEFTGNECQVLL
jgi:hypothetical protein